MNPSNFLWEERVCAVGEFQICLGELKAKIKSINRNGLTG